MRRKGWLLEYPRFLGSRSSSSLSALAALILGSTQMNIAQRGRRLARLRVFSLWGLVPVSILRGCVYRFRHCRISRRESRRRRRQRVRNWIRLARDIVDDLHQRSALIYWTDFLLSVTRCVGAGAVFPADAGLGSLPLLALLASAILFFRGGTFIHEIIHFEPVS